MDRNMMSDIYALYSDEFNIDSFLTNNAEAMLQLLIIYKHKLDLDFHDQDQNNNPISFDTSAFASIENGNTIVIGGKPLDESALDELTTGFVNNQVPSENENMEYRIYSMPEKKIVQITKVDSSISTSMIYGYGTCQLFMSLITKLLPWHFNLCEEQMVIVRDIAQKIISDNGLEQISNIFESVMIETGAVEKVRQDKLDKMGQRLLERRTGRLHEELESKQRMYDEYYAGLMRINREIYEAKIQIQAIENSQDDFENPIKELRSFIDGCVFDYQLADVDDDNVWLNFRVPLHDYTDEKDYNGSIKHGTTASTFISYFTGYGYDTSTIREAYKRIMETRDCKVWTCGQIKINMYSFTLDVENQITRENAMRHPHLNVNLRCFGTAHRPILDYLMQARVYEAMNAIAFATQQFTLGDSWARDVFLQGISEVECIECPDGEYRTFMGLMDAMQEGVL